VPAFVTSAALTSALAAAAAAAVDAKDEAYIDDLISVIGSNPRRRVVWNGVEVFNATVSGSCTRSGTQMLAPAVTANATGNATIASGSGYHRLEKASDAAVYVESLVDDEGTGLAGRVSADVVSGQPFTLAQAVYNAPGIDASSNYVDTAVDDMRTNDIVLSNAPDQDWMKGGVVVTGADARSIAQPSWWGGYTWADVQDYWTYLLPWYVVWDRPGHSANRNVRVRIRELELYVLEDAAPTTWSLIGSAEGPSGNSYARDAVGVGGNASGREESDGSYSAKLIPNGSIFHGYGAGSSDFDPATLLGIHVRARFQLILENPLGADERSLVAYAVDVGVDRYPFAGATTAQNGAGYWPGCCSSRWRAVGNSEIVVSTTNLSIARSIDNAGPPYNSRQLITEAAFRAAPPPAP